MKYDKTKDRAGTEEQFPYPMKLLYNKETNLFIVTVYKLPKTKTEAGIRDLYPSKHWLSDDVDYAANVEGYWKLALVIEGEAPRIIRYPKYSLKLDKTTYPYRPYKYESMLIKISNDVIHPKVGDTYEIDADVYGHGQEYVTLTMSQYNMYNFIYSLYSYNRKSKEDIFPYTAKFRASLRLVCFYDNIGEGESGSLGFGRGNYRTTWYSNTVTIDDIPINVE